MLLNAKKFWLTTSLLGLVVLPVMAHADGVSLNVNLGADDEAHYHFTDTNPAHHHSEMWQAAKKIQEAKHKIWNARKHHDFGGHAENSMQMLNGALDELRLAEDYARSH